jgi:aspartyl-tRNA(Asn)/glutamyl-tRNA(Gln) amidotransferase subunit A
MAGRPIPGIELAPRAGLRAVRALLSPRALDRWRLAPTAVARPAFRRRPAALLASNSRKIGYRLRMGNERVDPETAAAFEANLATLADLGAELIERNDPFENTLPVWGPLTFSIWACRFANVEQQLGDRMTSTLRHWMAEGRGFGATEVQSAMEARTRLFRQVQSWFKEIDFLATPTLAAPALPADQDPFKAVIIDGRDAGGLRDGWYPYTHPFNLSGHPAITLPNGFTKAGLPAGGLQLAAPWFADARLFSVSAAFEAAHGIDQRRPADWT